MTPSLRPDSDPVLVGGSDPVLPNVKGAPENLTKEIL